MNDERDARDIERLLQSVPAPLEVPAGLEEVARAAALEPGRETAGAAGGSARGVASRRMRRGATRWRLMTAATTLVAAAAASLLIGVGGRGQGIHVQSTVALAATGPSSSAQGSLQIGGAEGPMRPVVFKVSGLRPAPPGYYYEMWFGSGKEQVGMLAFNTGNDGTVTVRGEIPITMTWSRCWVTLENGRDEHEGQRAVLTSV